ncbi:hypothetical protein BDP81DRAFT_400966 [Colletotrichum phormii]|uniref:Uncharacterized protein n=1 Tax=Colletotrichum phormii TaxID=359342 RepID=A0AAJ0E7F9_9PEZI|nr:uncharacterized protein BDP81DRAFT_400966 [Colletotrichum phormii]KAK1621689.1 hypothetical protein BDP81DRAFT_400966 [Colletotrichum phormii]
MDTTNSTLTPTTTATTTTLAELGFLHDRQPATELPKDIHVLKEWYFTRCQTLKDAKALLGVYNTLVLDLGVTPTELYKWKANRCLGYRIAHLMVENAYVEDKISRERRKWVKNHSHVWCGQTPNHDMPCFEFSEDDREFLRGKWPQAWERYIVAQIEWALEVELEQARRFLPKKHERSVREENWRWLFGVDRWVKKIAFLAFDASGVGCEVGWKE